MTLFLDVRLAPVGGNLADTVATMQLTDTGVYQSLDKTAFVTNVQGRHVLVATHGFNVDRAAGIAALSNWKGLLQLSDPSVFVGVLWPGDSIWLHGLDYPGEPKVADHTGELIAAFIEDNFGGAASISFASHSLGARVLLQTVSRLSRPVRRATIMAGAIDDNCLTAEFQAAAAKIGEISVLASHKDEVLSAAFPLGNFVGGILDAGHPWARTALGRSGPASPWPSNFKAPFQIPDDWGFGHGDYLRVVGPPAVTIAPPVAVPPKDAPAPSGNGAQEAWTAAFESTRFQ